MIPIDAYVELGSECGRTIKALRMSGFRLALAEGPAECGPDGIGSGGFRLLRYSRDRRGIGIAEFGTGMADVLYVRLDTVRLDELDEAMGRHPNIVKSILVKFSDLRELYRTGRLNMGKLRALFDIALDHHAPLLMGSGAKAPDGVLGPRVLYSALSAMEGNFWERSDYRRVMAYLYDRAVI